MTRSYLRFALVAIASLAAAVVTALAVEFPAAVFRWVERGVAFVWTLTRDLARDLVIPSDPTAETWGGSRGEPLEPSLLNSLRHEAGMRALPG